MRPFNLNEIEDKIISDYIDITSSDRVYAQDKITQFLNFLQDQPISKRILERINEDFSMLKNELPLDQKSNTYIDPKVKNKVKSLLKSSYDQGAFGFFIIQNSFEIERKFDNHYFEASATWYELIGHAYENRFECFKERFFKPFIDLLKWYIYESQARSEKDYFSKDEIAIINEKLDRILTVQTASFEVIFEEVNDLKELIITINKKNWGILLREKLKDLILGGIINQDNAEALYNDILGLVLPLLNKH
ncbi:hypothetical protein [Flavobacterium anhuiense]|uniref:hypothetical protein n=1 Tax=Flavobacterium anhuiense TaxID=459526 RepID=UPI0034D96EE8